jgi:SH3 domain
MTVGKPYELPLIYDRCIICPAPNFSSLPSPLGFSILSYIYISFLVFSCSSIEGESSWNTEDIDFEFVYALHTFAATVEGQANAMKGDTMVLLDDSNNYWWLVRVVKDGSIGQSSFLHLNG